MEFFSSKDIHTFYLEQDGKWLHGLHQGSYSTQEVNGVIEGEKIKLKSMARKPGDNIAYLFSGVLNGDEIKGSIHLGEYRTANFVAIRNKTTSPKEPINIPGGPPLAT